MATYVLDTNVVSALMAGDASVEDRLLEERPGSVLLPQPVIAEIRYGLARLSRSRRRSALTERFELLAGTLSRAEWTDPVSEHYGAIKARLETTGERIEDFDVAIAAHALAIDAIVATRNVKHLSRISGLTVERW